MQNSPSHYERPYHIFASFLCHCNLVRPPRLNWLTFPNVKIPNSCFCYYIVSSIDLVSFVLFTYISHSRQFRSLLFENCFLFLNLSLLLFSSSFLAFALSDSSCLLFHNISPFFFEYIFYYFARRHLVPFPGCIFLFFIYASSQIFFYPSHRVPYYISIIVVKQCPSMFSD